jgi:hypothetical protein
MNPKISERPVGKTIHQILHSHVRILRSIGVTGKVFPKASPGESQHCLTRHSAELTTSARSCNFNDLSRPGCVYLSGHRNCSFH